MRSKVDNVAEKWDYHNWELLGKISEYDNDELVELLEKQMKSLELHQYHTGNDLRTRIYISVGYNIYFILKLMANEK